MLREAELIKEGVAAYELEKMVGDWESRNMQPASCWTAPASENLDWQNIAAIRKIGNINKFAAMRD
jgi:hypothetical protein